MTVRAKFKLIGVKTYESSMWNYETQKSENLKVCDMEFTVVSPHHTDSSGKPIGTSDENAAFWSSTPSGSIHLGTVNQAAIEEFLSSLGKEFYVTFELAPGEPTGIVHETIERRSY